MESARNFGALADLEGRHSQLAGKRYEWPVNVFPNFATRMVISDISTNLAFYEISSKYWRFGRLGRDTVPSGRKTLHMAGGAFPDPGTRLSDFGKRDRLCDPKGYFHKFTLLRN